MNNQLPPPVDIEQVLRDVRNLVAPFFLLGCAALGFWVIGRAASLLVHKLPTRVGRVRMLEGLLLRAADLCDADGLALDGAEGAEQRELRECLRRLAGQVRQWEHVG